MGVSREAKMGNQLSKLPPSMKRRKTTWRCDEDVTSMEAEVLGVLVEWRGRKGGVT
jgi:hypothetical protein